MNVTNACQCCLLRPPDMDLKTPYRRLEQTEIYSDMLKECFEIHVEQSIMGTCGICVVCISRLRNAYDFKRQVQRCQAKLQARLTQEPVAKGLEEVSSDYKHVTQEEDKSGEPLTFVEVTVEVEPHTEKSAESSPGPHEEAGSVSQQSDCGKQKTLQCHICDQQFPTSSLLDDHIKRHAADIPPHMLQELSAKDYSCEVCNKQFKLKGNWATHMRTHTGVKPYSCKVCSKQFTNKRNMIYHNRSHTGEKPYSCEVCMRRFSNKNTLSLHKRTHADVEDRPFSCDLCSNRFTQKNNLRIHRRIHTGETPYACDLCSKQFISKHSLIRHCQSSHAKES